MTALVIHNGHKKILIFDPRLFFVAECTLLSLNKTRLIYIAFVFLIMRFGFYLKVLLFCQRR